MFTCNLGQSESEIARKKSVILKTAVSANDSTKDKFCRKCDIVKITKKYTDQNYSASLVSIFAAFTTKNMRK